MSFLRKEQMRKKINNYAKSTFYMYKVYLRKLKF